MSDQHTKGRIVVLGEWLVPEAHESRLIGGSTNKAQDRNEYAHSIALVRGKYQDDAANARRLAACWNACEDIPTADLEAGATLAEICAKSNGYQVKLAAANTELAAARALLRDIQDTEDGVSLEVDKKIRSYLDASDKQGGSHV